MKLLKIYLDGEMIEADEKRLHALRPGTLKAKGAFETILVYKKKIHAWQDHINRLRKGLAAQGISFAFNENIFRQIIKDLMKINRLSNARVRISVWQKNRKTHFCVIAAKLEEGQESYSLGVVDIKHPKSKLNSFKTLNYAIFYKAFNQASRQGYDEALLLDKKKHIVEGSRTNIFLIKDNELLTPSLKSHCLNGITRKYVFKAARGFRFRCKEANLKFEDLLSADLVFVTNALRGLIKVHSIDGKNTSEQKSAIRIYKSLRHNYDMTIPKTALE
jgi:branched-subunit amino acid aminotransferase/4-amino-4-deoxychorismate lyase